MSGPGPFGQNPFEGMGFLGDLAKLLTQQAGDGWEAARALAVGIATDGQQEANVDPLERMRIEQIARVAELHVAERTGLATSITGRPVTVMAVNRSRWVSDTLDAYRPLLERMASALSAAPALPEPPEESIEDPLTGMLQSMVQALQPLMVSMAAGSMVGRLGRRCFGQYDLPIPRPRSDDVLVVVPAIDAFAQRWSLPVDGVRLWVCLHELANHAVLGVPHVRRRLQGLLEGYIGAFRSDPGAIEQRLRELDLPEPTSPSGLQQIFGSPEAILGVIRSSEQHAMLPQLQAIVAIVVGVVDHVLDVAGAKLIPNYSQLAEALRRRRAEASDADRFVEQLLGLELTQDTYDLGARFVEGVVERAGEEGVRRLWEAERMLPTPAEITAPGLWLARIDLPEGA